MAITVIKDGPDSATIEIAKGDLKALNEVMEDYNFADKTGVIAFSIGVLREAKGKPLSVSQDDGSRVRFEPADKLKKDGNK